MAVVAGESIVNSLQCENIKDYDTLIFTSR